MMQALGAEMAGAVNDGGTLPRPVAAVVPISLPTPEYIGNGQAPS